MRAATWIGVFEVGTFKNKFRWGLLTGEGFELGK